MQMCREEREKTEEKDKGALTSYQLQVEKKRGVKTRMFVFFHVFHKVLANCRAVGAGDL